MCRLFRCRRATFHNDVETISMCSLWW
jgi:hypothetical protein